jgi:hypothetical protein
VPTVVSHGVRVIVTPLDDTVGGGAIQMSPPGLAVVQALVVAAVPTQSIFAPAGMPVPVTYAYRALPVPVAPPLEVKGVPEHVISPTPVPVYVVHPVIVWLGVTMNAT